MLGQVRLVRLGQARLDQVRLGQVRLGQVRISQVKLASFSMILLHFLLATHRGSAVTLPPHSSTGFTTFPLTDLQPFANYSVMVSAETEQGEGPFSEPIFCLTEQSGKGQWQIFVSIGQVKLNQVRLDFNSDNINQMVTVSVITLTTIAFTVIK